MLVAGAGAVTLLVLFLVFGASFLCNVIGFVYPAIASFRAIESVDPAAVKQWLMYWVVYAFCNCIEAFASVLVLWFPFYYSAKFGFLLYLFLPQTRGALFLYDNFVRQLLKGHEARADAAMAQTAGTIDGAADKKDD